MKVRVSSFPARFRRAGIEFSREPKEIEVDEKTAEILKAEPMLRVDVVEEDDPKGKKGKKE